MPFAARINGRPLLAGAVAGVHWVQSTGLPRNATERQFRTPRSITSSLDGRGRNRAFTKIIQSLNSIVFGQPAHPHCRCYSIGRCFSAHRIGRCSIGLSSRLSGERPCLDNVYSQQGESWHSGGIAVLCRPKRTEAGSLSRFYCESLARVH